MREGEGEGESPMAVVVASYSSKYYHLGSIFIVDAL